MYNISSTGLCNTHVIDSIPNLVYGLTIRVMTVLYKRRVCVTLHSFPVHHLLIMASGNEYTYDAGGNEYLRTKE